MNRKTTDYKVIIENVCIENINYCYYNFNTIIFSQ